MAMTFCGEAIGDAMPPRLEANAMPMIKHGPNGDPTGSVRRIGWIKDKHRTGAATLLIHMLAMEATNMLTKSTRDGQVPALDKTKEANAFAIPYLLSAAAIAKPPSSSIITGDSMDAKTALEASIALNL